MKTLKQIISVVLFLLIGMSAVFNILFLFGRIGETLLHIGVVILVFAVFLVSVLGIILKNVRKEQYVTINITTPAQELGILYSGALIVWVVTYFLALINR